MYEGGMPGGGKDALQPFLSATPMDEGYCLGNITLVATEILQGQDCWKMKGCFPGCLTLYRPLDAHLYFVVFALRRVGLEVNQV